MFNLTFAIAADAIVSKLLFDKVGITDPGSFESFNSGRGTKWWGENNVAQPDGFFVSANSLLGVELKVKTKSSLQQILKYIALMVMEEHHSSKRQNLGLLFIAPKQDETRFWTKCGLRGPTIDYEAFIDRASLGINPYMSSLLKKHGDHFKSVVDRLHLKLLSWTQLRDDMLQINGGLDQKDVGQQTLHRLLDGLREQIEINKDTGV